MVCRMLMGITDHDDRTQQKEGPTQKINKDLFWQDDQKSMQDERNAGNFEQKIVPLPEHNPKKNDAYQVVEARKKQKDHCTRGENVSC